MRVMIWNLNPPPLSHTYLQWPRHSRVLWQRLGRGRDEASVIDVVRARHVHYLEAVGCDEVVRKRYVCLSSHRLPDRSWWRRCKFYFLVLISVILNMYNSFVLFVCYEWLWARDHVKGSLIIRYPTRSVDRTFILRHIVRKVHHYGHSSSHFLLIQ